MKKINVIKVEEVISDSTKRENMVESCCIINPLTDEMIGDCMKS